MKTLTCKVQDQIVSTCPSFLHLDSRCVAGEAELLSGLVSSAIFMVSVLRGSLHGIYGEIDPGVLYAMPTGCMMIQVGWHCDVTCERREEVMPTALRQECFSKSSAFWLLNVFGYRVVVPEQWPEYS